MSATAQETQDKASALQIITTKLASFDALEQRIPGLKHTYGGVVFDVTTAKGMAAAKAARAAVREPRFECETFRKELKAPILELGRQVDSRAKEITTALEAIEDPIHEQITNEEARKEREREAKIKAEQERTEGIQRRIDAIRAWPINAAGKPSVLVAQMLLDANSYTIGEEFAEFVPMATQAITASRAALVGIHAERLAHEAEQAKLEADRKELEALRAQAAEREAADKARRDAEEKEAKDRRDAEAALQAAQLKAEKAEQDRLLAERQAELDRQALAQLEQQRLTREANEAEQRRLAQERAELARQQEAQRLKDEQAEAVRAEQARIASVTRPTDDELVAVLAAHYRVPTAKVVEWLPIAVQA